jgi:hypothetical protein
MPDVEACHMEVDPKLSLGIPTYRSESSTAPSQKNRCLAPLIIVLAVQNRQTNKLLSITRANEVVGEDNGWSTWYVVPIQSTSDIQS